MDRNKLTVLGFAVLLFVILPLSIFLIEKQQEIKSNAQANTLLSFQQAGSNSSTNTIQAPIGSTVSLDLLLAPGTNQISLVKAEIDYDPTKLAITNSSSFQPNTASFPQIVEGPVFSSGKMLVTLSIGADPSKVITQPTKIGTLTFSVIGNTGSTGTTVNYGTNTQALAIGPSINLNENVVAGTTNMTIISSGQTQPPVCRNAPTDIMLVIDRSDSMNKDNKLLDAQTAAQNFVDIIAQQNNGSRVGLVSFAPDASLDAPLTTDFSSVKTAITNVKLGFGTCTDCAVRQVNQAFAADTSSNKKVVVLLTDGLANWLVGGTKIVPSSQAEQATLTDITNGPKIPYYTIGLGADVNDNFLQQVANQTGGLYYFTPDASQLGQIYQQISQVVGKGSVDGTVFTDSNKNGTFDPGEQPLAGWTLQLLTNGVATPQTVVSNSSGTFAITNLCDNTYTLQEVNQPGWQQTTPKNYTITITNGSSVTNENFGNYPIPTGTPIPTTTPTPAQETALAATILLHGIGSAGDNSNPTGNSYSNKNPLHPVRQATVSIFSADNQLLASSSATVNYSSSSGSFTGQFTLPTPISTGDYTVKISMDQYLTRQLAGIQTIQSGKINQLPPATLVTGDANDDNQLNILDYNLLLQCYSDLTPATDCSASQEVATDFNDDGFVNQIDYNLFLREIANQPGQ